MTDVIVVGGGPAGALAAMILARSGARVHLYDRARFPRAKLCGDTLNPGAMRVLADHVPLAPLLDRSLPLEGMLLTGPGGVEVRGRYGRGLVGRSITRRELDTMLVRHAISAGAQFVDHMTVTAPMFDAVGHITGVVCRGSGGTRRPHRARLVIAADGRESRLARAVGLARYPVRPRRWAVGGYFEGVDGLSNTGEMHVRAGRYIGVAPMPGDLTNACLVVPHTSVLRAWRDHGPRKAGTPREASERTLHAAAALAPPGWALMQALADDERLGPRFARARLVAPPRVLGPMAVDASAAGVPGMLLAGDAAGFIDPITGDGLRFAFTGAALAAAVALEILAGRLDPSVAAARLTARRRAAFAGKWRFNRTLRRLVASNHAIGAATACARLVPAVFESMIRYAGDCHAAADR